MKIQVHDRYQPTRSGKATKRTYPHVSRFVEKMFPTEGPDRRAKATVKILNELGQYGVTTRPSPAHGIGQRFIICNPSSEASRVV